MNPIRPTAFALPALAALAFVACGYPTFTFNGTGGGTTSSTGATSTTSTTGETTTSTSSAGGGGAGGMMTTTTSTSATTGGTGGSGGTCDIFHPGGGTCEYLLGAECGCAAKQKCGVSNEVTGAASCVLIGSSPQPLWSKCNSDGDCASGTWCDHYTNVCKKICNNMGDCGPDGQCIPATKKGEPDIEIPGLKVCTAHCNPQTAAPCGANLTCYYDQFYTEFDCASTLKLAVGAECKSANSCDKGLVCVGDGSGKSFCQRWCHPVDDIWPSGFCSGFLEGTPYCLGVSIQVQYGGAPYGVCSPTPF